MTFSVYILAPLLIGLSICFAVFTRMIWGGRTLWAVLQGKWTASTSAHFVMVSCAIFSAVTGILGLVLIYKWLMTVVTW